VHACTTLSKTDVFDRLFEPARHIFKHEKITLSSNAWA